MDSRYLGVTLLKVQSPDQQYQNFLGTCQKCKFASSIPDLLNLKLQECLRSHPDDSGTFSRLKAIVQGVNTYHHPFKFTYIKISSFLTVGKFLSFFFLLGLFFHRFLLQCNIFFRLESLLWVTLSYFSGINIDRQIDIEIHIKYLQKFPQSMSF